MKEELILTEDWDKTFPKSDKVNHRKVTFHNRYGITLAADLYEPKDASGKLAAIAVCGPVRRCKGTGCRFVCADNGREGIPYHRL